MKSAHDTVIKNLSRQQRHQGCPLEVSILKPFHILERSATQLLAPDPFPNCGFPSHTWSYSSSHATPKPILK